MPDTPETIASRDEALRLNTLLRTSPPPTTPTTPQNDLGSVIQQGSSFKISDSGSEGAVLVSPGNGMNGVGAAIKIESSVTVGTAGKCGALMSNFFSRAQGTPPFVAPRTKVYSSQDLLANPDLAKDLKEKLEDAKQYVSKSREANLDDRISQLEEVKTGDSAILLMEFANGQQLNKMSPEQKSALMRSEGFAQAIGRSMAPSMALGLSDHMGTTDSAGFKANASNLMYDTATGQISMIDFDSRNTPLNVEGTMVRVGEPNLAQNLENMRTFIEDAMKSPDNFERAIVSMMDPKSDTPFNAAMNTFLKPGGDSFFTDRRTENRLKTGKSVATKDLAPNQDELALESLTEDVKRDFAANLLRGAVEGLEYVQKNQQALEQSVKEMQEVQNGQKIDHFYKPEEMQELKDEMAKLDVKALKTGLDQRMNEVTQSRKNGLQTFIKSTDEKITLTIPKQMTELQQKIDRLTQNPTATDKLKALFSTKGHEPIDKLNNQMAKLKGDLDFAKDIKQQAESQLDFFNKMEATSKLTPQTPSQSNTVDTPAPKVSVKDALAQKTQPSRLPTPDDSMRNREGARAKPRLRDTDPTLGSATTNKTVQSNSVKPKLG